MTGTDQTREFTTANLAAWEEAAPIHGKMNQAQLIEAFREPGFSCLDEVETRRLEALGVVGKDVAQICCNNGRELLSVKNMGAARCVGFDGAQGFVDQGRELAQAGGLEVEFVCTDVYDIDEHFGPGFDLVTITIGVLSWMPDLERIFSVFANLIKPEGALFIFEQHPILEMIEPAGPRALSHPVRAATCNVAAQTRDLPALSPTPLANPDGVRPVRRTDRMSRPGGAPGQRPIRPAPVQGGGRFTPTLGPGGALVSLLRR